MSEANDGFILALIPKQAIFKGEVQITSFPFKVGRREPSFRQFLQCGPEAKLGIGKISRNHATITHDGKAFSVCDHGSLNGTYVNRQRIEVETPTHIQDGDTLGFSEYVEFVVQVQQSMIMSSPLPPEEGGPIIMDPSPEPEPEPAREPEPEPKPEESVNDKVAVTTPSGVQLPKGAASPSDSNKDGAARSGSGVQLPKGAIDPNASSGDGAVKKASGVQLPKSSGDKPSSEKTDPETSKPALPEGADDQQATGLNEANASELRKGMGKGTIVPDAIDRASSLSSLIAQSKVEVPEKEEGAGDSKSRVTGTRTHAAKKAGWGKLWGESRLAKVIAIAGIVIGIATYSIYTVLHDDVATIREMVEAENYRMAMGYGNARLGDGPNPEIEEFVLLSAVREMVGSGDWCALLDSQDYDGARDRVRSIADAANNSKDVAKMVEFVMLAIEFMERGERLQRTRKVRVYEDDGRYEEMLERWKNNQASYQSTAALIKQMAPNCPDMLALMNNHRSRFLDFKRSLVKQVTLLKRDVERALEEKRSAEILKICDRFEETMNRNEHTVTVDISPIRRDATLYVSVIKAIQDRDVFPLLTVDEQSFRTPPFKKYAPAVLAMIPPKPVLDLFRTVRMAWRQGQGEDALRELLVDSAGDWKSAAVALKADYKSKMTTIARLEALSSPIKETDWPFVVDAIRTDLSGPDDALYRAKYESVYTQALNSARLKAVDAYDQAKRLWKEYDEAGPITQTHRLSTTVSENYVALASSLKGAVDAVVRWKTLADLIGEPIPPVQFKFWELVMKECRFQWRRMNKAKELVSKPLIQKKIMYLPQPTEEWK